MFFLFLVFLFTFLNLYTPLKIDISPEMVGRWSFPFEMVPFQVTCIFSGGGSRFCEDLYLAWFLQIRLASFLWLFLHFLGQKRWEHWEIVFMDSSNNETTTHVFFNWGIPHYIRFLGCICVVCCFMSFLVCLFFLLALWVTFFCVDLDYLIIWIPTPIQYNSSVGWWHLAFFTQLQILSG